MSYTRERDEFIAAIANAGLSTDTARKFLRHAATMQRLSIASCNGDWPADNGERKVKFCDNCQSGWVPSSYARGMCPDCRSEANAKAFAASVGVSVAVQGDPRGYVLRVVVNGREIGVPARG